MKPPLTFLASLVGALAVACGQAPARAPADRGPERSAILPDGPPSDFFVPAAVGDPIRGNERPRIANVQVVDLDGDKLPDIVVCDAAKNVVSWIRQFPAGTF